MSAFEIWHWLINFNNSRQAFLSFYFSVAFIRCTIHTGDGLQVRLVGLHPIKKVDFAFSKDFELTQVYRRHSELILSMLLQTHRFDLLLFLDDLGLELWAFDAVVDSLAKDLLVNQDIYLGESFFLRSQNLVVEESVIDLLICHTIPRKKVLGL